MKVFDAAGIRNVALVGHSGAGKTQLASALLFDAGRRQPVRQGGRGHHRHRLRRRSDCQEAHAGGLAGLPRMEQAQDQPHRHARHGQLPVATPARRCASPKRPSVVVDAVAGVQVSTEKVWAEADEAQLPRLVVCNRLDRERASLERTLEAMRSTLGRNCIPVQLPIGEERDFKGVVDLVAMKAYTFAADESGQDDRGRGARRAWRRRRRAARESLIEMVAEADDALMEKFFEAGTLTQEELTAGLGRAVRAGRLFPVLCASGLRNIGIQPLADAIVSYVAVAGRTAVRRDATPRASETDARGRRQGAARRCGSGRRSPIQFAGRITLFRVVSGVLKSDATVHNITRDVPERFGHVLAVQGKTQTHVPGAARGRPRRRRQAQGHAHRRHARRQGRRLRRAAAQVPGTRARLRHRAQEPRRRGQDRHRHAAAAAKRIRRSATRAIRRRTSCCSPARASCTSR